MHEYLTDELGITPVDKNSSIPYYQQVRIELMGMLQSGKIKPGDMLPPEKDLANAYLVSRQTIRQAIGLFILESKNRLKFFLDQSFAQQIISMGLTPHSEVLRKKISTIDGSAPGTLQPKKGSPALELFRLRFGDDYPIGIQYTIIVTDLCPDLHAQDFEKESLYRLLLNKYKLFIVRIDHTVSAVFPDEWHKNLLKVTNNSPLILVNTTAYLDNNEPIEASTSYYRADRYEFSISKNF